jgi:hypothetical protein
MRLSKDDVLQDHLFIMRTRSNNLGNRAGHEPESLPWCGNRKLESPVRARNRPPGLNVSLERCSKEKERLRIDIGDDPDAGHWGSGPFAPNDTGIALRSFGSTRERNDQTEKQGRAHRPNENGTDWQAVA